MGALEVVGEEEWATFQQGKKKKAAAIPTSEQPERAAAASSKALQFHFYFQMMALLIAFCIPCSSVVSFCGVSHRALEGLP